jgi:hypothetical protein
MSKTLGILPQGIPIMRWEDNIKTNFKEISCEDVRVKELA